MGAARERGGWGSEERARRRLLSEFSICRGHDSAPHPPARLPARFLLREGRGWSEVEWSEGLSRFLSQSSTAALPRLLCQPDRLPARPFGDARPARPPAGEAAERWEGEARRCASWESSCAAAATPRTSARPPQEEAV